MTSWPLIAVFVAHGLAPLGLSQPSGPPANLVVHGKVSALVGDFFRRENTRELRARAEVNLTADPRSWIRLRFEGIGEVLVADRAGRVDDAAFDVLDAWVELRANNAEVRAGYGRVVWGRLDEIMPSDVINPIDAAKFFLGGRADARLAVPFLRSRVFLPSETVVETVVALPGRRGRFDGLDEATSPFNLFNDLVLPAGVQASRGVRRETPSASWRNLQQGLRVSTTVDRVDMSVSAWRGFEGFGIVSFEPVFEANVSVVGELVERYPRVTMIAGDVATVRGGWAIRGEVAAFVDKTLSAPRGAVKGRAVDAGVGVDRAAGDYHVFGSLVWHREWSSMAPLVTRDYLNVVGSIDRRFSRDRYLARVFGVVNPEDRSGFLRGLFSWSVRDNMLLEASGGLFLGEGQDAISRFTDRDFAFLRVGYQF